MFTFETKKFQIDYHSDLKQETDWNSSVVLHYSNR